MFEPPFVPLMCGYPTGFLERHFYYHVQTEEENRAALKRLAEWWTWKQYYERFDRCCHRF